MAQIVHSLRRRIVWFPVRCCCSPRNLFGFVAIEPAERVVRTRSGKSYKVELRDYGAVEKLPDASDPFGRPVYSTETAIYSDDRPIEFWRTIEGFVEASGDAR